MPAIVPGSANPPTRAARPYWLRAAAVLALLGALLWGLSGRVPPLQSPDEHSHLARAWMLSQGQWRLDTPPGGSSGGEIDLALLRFHDIYLSGIARDASARLTPAQRQELAGLQWSAQRAFFPLPGTGYYLPLVYAPQALGLALGQWTQQTVPQSYALARLCTLAVCLGLLAAAWWLFRPGALTWALVLLPMSLFQLVSPTLDGLTTSLLLLALSAFLRLMAGPRPGTAALPRGLPALLCLALLVLVTSRAHWLPLLVLPFALAWHRRRQGQGGASARAWLLAGMALLGLALAWTLWALGHTVDLRVTRSHTTGQAVALLVQQPAELLRVMAGTLTDPVLPRFYLKSFIGILGWLDTPLPRWGYPALGLALLGCAGLSLRAPRDAADGATRALLLGLALATALLVFVAMLITWTPLPAGRIEGVQGRYFLGSALLLAGALGGLREDDPAPRGPGLALAATAALSLGLLLATLQARYG